MPKIFDDTNIKPFDIDAFLNKFQTVEEIEGFLIEKGYTFSAKSVGAKDGVYHDISMITPDGLEIKNHISGISIKSAWIKTLELIPFSRQRRKVVTENLRNLFAMENKEQMELFKSAIQKVETALDETLAELEKAS